MAGAALRRARGARDPLAAPKRHGARMVNTTTPAASKLACDIIRDHLGALAEVCSKRRDKLHEARLTCFCCTARGSLARVRWTADAGRAEPDDGALRPAALCCARAVRYLRLTCDASQGLALPHVKV